MRKIPFAGIELTSQRVRGYMVPLSYRGDRFDRSPPVGHLYFHFLVFSEKNPVCRDRTHVPTCQRLHGTSELPGTGSPMKITLLGQQYNVGERPTVVLLLLLLIHTLATEETTVTQQVSHRPIKCQSRLWSQRGTKVNGSHHGDNPLLRPTGIQIATKSYASLQAMAPTNIKTVHQTSTPYREQPRSTRNAVAYPRPTFSAKTRKNYGTITLQPVLIIKSKILKATHCTEIRKNEIPRSMVVEALSWRSRRASQHPAVQSPVHP